MEECLKRFLQIRRALLQFEIRAIEEMLGLPPRAKQAGPGDGRKADIIIGGGGSKAVAGAE
jgi:hypothetical protein